MRRGGSLHSPRPRALAATRQAPSFLLSEDQKVFRTVSRDLKDRAFWEVRGLPRKEGDLGKKGEGRQALPWDQQNRRSCGKLRDTSQRRGKKPQPRAHAAF
ncbi:unnamed protein product [Pipistrellus nathusii]|uniref:Uncharacterized protein n=1 Tax=Pipistrellus nathusii TaxID=59473 RepID=A0ABN9ZU33_PIPNA